MSDAMPSLLVPYEDAVARGALRADAAQRKAIAALDALMQGDVAPAPRSWFSFGKAKHTTPQGIYLWGDVGRGKSMVMDLFFATIQKQCRARRAHFHAFMLDVHKRMFAYRQIHEGEVIEHVITEIARETQVLCLDEMQVSDVADAMILARLFTGLLDAGVMVVFTSNRRPRDLYQGGLQRDQFLKFVAVLEARVQMIEVNGAEDYRLAKLKALARTYVHPCDAAADDFLLSSWQSLTENAPSEPLHLLVDGRTLRIDKHANGIAWLTFDELCKRALGASDYLMLSKQCHTVLLQCIPQLSPEDRNEAKRFVTLIDTLYDARVKLIATAAVAAENLYPAGDGNFEFHRTVSRLHEMQSEAYWGLAHHG